MNQDPVTQIIILSFCGWAAVAGAYAVISYMHLAPWWTSTVGRWYLGLLAAFTIGLAMLFVSRLITGDITRVAWVIISAGFAAVMTGNAWAIRKTQRATNKATAEAEEADHAD
jgi:hypothetical protein